MTGYGKRRPTKPWRPLHRIPTEPVTRPSSSLPRADTAASRCLLQRQIKCDLLLSMNPRIHLKPPSLFIALAALAAALFGQSATDTTNWTAAQDHQNMLDQLGIKALRPGPSGNEAALNHANYDEAKANPYPDLPEVLTLKNGKKVTTPAMWWNQRRPEIVEDMEREMYGRMPKNIPKVTWTVRLQEREFIGFTPVIAKRLTGHVDNSAYPFIN